MFEYTEDRYSPLNNVPVYKLDYGIGMFQARGVNDYRFLPLYGHSVLHYSPDFQQAARDMGSLLEQYKVAHIGRRREVICHGRKVLDNIQCNFGGKAYSLPKGFKQLLNQQDIVPIVLIPNDLGFLQDRSRDECKKLNVLNLKKFVMNIGVVSEIENYLYDNLFYDTTADLTHIEPLGELVYERSKCREKNSLDYFSPFARSALR